MTVTSVTDFDLSSYLAEQAAGGTSQGEGDFTISHEKAARKMAEYSLPREHAWVLKLIQAGVGWGCDSIKVTQTRLNSTFYFQFSDFRKLPTNKELVSAILRADLESTRPLDAFAMGLRLVVEKSHLSFLLLIDTPDVEPQAIYAGVYFGELDEKERAAKRQNWTSGVTVMIHHIAHSDENRLLLNYVPLKRHGLPMIAELEEYAFTCPVPLTVDGRRLDGIFRTGRFHWKGDFKPLRSAGLEVPDDLDPPFAICPGFDNRAFSLFDPRAQLSKLDTPARAEAFFLLAARSDSMLHYSTWKVKSTLFWVRDGVIVDQDDLELPRFSERLRLFVFVNADGLRSDLTGFQLIRDELRCQRTERVLHRVARALELERQADRNILERPPTIEQMEDEQLDDLSLPARAVTLGLRQVDKALEKSKDPRFEAGRLFARQVIKKSFKALQEVVQEPDYWTKSSFAKLYPDELSVLAKSLSMEFIGEKIIMGFTRRPEPEPEPEEEPEEVPQEDFGPLAEAKKERYVWVPPDER